MTRYKQLPVVCACGLNLALYNKGGSGRLRKMYFGRILKDYEGLFVNTPPIPLDTDILCPGCGKRVGTVKIVGGHAAVKINQGTVRA